MKKAIANFALAAGLAALAGSASAGESVWRYVDPETGAVSYSNIQIKGKKGQKVEMMKHPEVSAAAYQPYMSLSEREAAARAQAATPPAAVAAAVASEGMRVPEELLRQLRSGSDKPPIPPSALPPLPVAGAGETAPSFPSLQLRPSLPETAASAADQGPAWAKPKTTPAGVSAPPSWSKDPFSHP